MFDKKGVLTMKKFILLHVGFKQSTPEIMGEWKKWFESIADITIENSGFCSAGREVSKEGTQELPMGLEAMTGYTILNAESMDEAEKIAARNPFISSIRIYEIRTM